MLREILGDANALKLDCGGGCNRMHLLKVTTWYSHYKEQ